jgi:Right handed beta helix region
MKRVTVTFLVVLAVTLTAATAQAQAIRTWVSGVGDDANPCSRTAPCKTFAGAISKTAAHGEISVLDPGGFGAVVITKSMTINGIGTHAGISASGANGITINAGANDVIVLRNLQVNGAGSGLAGIRLLSLGTNVVIDRVIVQGFATGILTTDTSTGNVTVIDSTITDNHGFGVLAQGGSISVLDSKIVSNQVAVQADPMGTVRLSNNDVMNNKTGFGCGAGILASAANNRKANNVGGLVPVCTPTMTITVQ